MPIARPTEPRHVVVIVGGAVAGSEAAAVVAEHGGLAVVLERGERPYGKIEDGLPRWHEKLRDKEYARIDDNLGKEGVELFAGVGLGADVMLPDIVGPWGASACLLASGAWRDRPLGLPGVDDLVGRGFVYQNPLVYWFNHHEEDGFDGERHDIPDGAICVGGGLASIDVVKILSMEIFGRALRDRGIEASMLELEHQGIRQFLEDKGITKDELGVAGVTLYYRRHKRDMPLAAMPPEADPKVRAKIHAAREKIMDLVIDKFFVTLKECHVPIAPLVDGDRMVGLRFRRTAVANGRLVEVAGSEVEVRSPLTVSSIGSIPERLEGLPMDGDLLRWKDPVTGQLDGYDNVFGLGNVLTGRGNIKESRKNAHAVATGVMEHVVVNRPPLPPAAIEDILARAARVRNEP